MTSKKTEEKLQKKTNSSKESSLEITIYDVEGGKTSTIELPKEIFDVKTSAALLAQYVRVYLANQRQGTQSAKTRGEVVGSTRKIYRQKGTGRARHGDIKAPIFVGGGVAHPPKPRDFSMSLNKKQRRRALYGALSLKAKDGDLYIVDGLLQIKPKTKSMTAALRKLGLLDQTSLLLVYPQNKADNLILAMRNLVNLDYCDFASLNAYAILKHKKLIFAKEVVEALKIQPL